jgi:polyferredoxin
MGKKNNQVLRFTRLGHRLVQVGFLFLFLFPLSINIYKKYSFSPAPTFTSWLLAWDPILLIGQVLNRHFGSLVVGAPVLLLVLSFLFGRFFCGWICPIGTVLDITSMAAFWRKRKTLRPLPGVFPVNRNRSLRYYVLAAILGASLISVKFLGLLDPLVIFQRSSTALAANYFSIQQPGLRSTMTWVSLILLGILILEVWQPRFWCRNLCPLGAIISLFSRFSILQRKVSPAACTHCNQCQRICSMNAIPIKVEETDLTQCTFCLECSSACPKEGISFSFNRYAPAKKELFTRRESPAQSLINRRSFIGKAAATAAVAVIMPLTDLTPRKKVLRPPGALPEETFIKTCILCQECIRVCPTGGLRPAGLESGLSGIGTPVLVPRQGGCALNPSCPDMCAQVCPVGAIQPIRKDQIKIGIAKVHREACLAWDQGAKCLVCVEACLNSAAIAYSGRVTVDPNRCTGCGRCESGCPVPGSAIRVEPFGKI